MPMIRTKMFSILNMKDEYDEAFQTLFDAMYKQNPDINADALDSALRSVISTFGNGNSGYNNSSFAALANEETNVQAIYSLSGDLLSLACEAFKSDDKKQAKELFEAAMEETDIDVLIDAIQVNNKNSKIGIAAAENSNDDAMEDTNEITDLTDDDDDQSDGLESNKPVDNEVQMTKVSSNMKKETVSKNDSDEEEEDKDKSNIVDMKKVRKPMSKEESLIRAAANRLSMDGSKESRIEAKKLRSI